MTDGWRPRADVSRLGAVTESAGARRGRRSRCAVRPVCCGRMRRDSGLPDWGLQPIVCIDMPWAVVTFTFPLARRQDRECCGQSGVMTCGWGLLPQEGCMTRSIRLMILTVFVGALFATPAVMSAFAAGGGGGGGGPPGEDVMRPSAPPSNTKSPSTTRSTHRTKKAQKQSFFDDPAFARVPRQPMRRSTTATTMPRRSSSSRRSAMTITRTWPI